jgi:hypothetical protein
MRRLVPAALLAAATAACGPTREWAPLEVDWTFGGKSCTDAGVAKMQIDIDGEILTPNVFYCAPGSANDASLGADLGTFLPGPYTTTVTGFDSAGNLIFQSTRTIQVLQVARNVIHFDAAPTTGTATLHWSFAGKGCDAAGVTTVRVSLDNLVITDAQNNPALPCKLAITGGTLEGTTIGPLSPGSHTFALAAQSSTANYAIANVNLTVTAGQDTLQPVDLPVAAPTTASADVRWNFQPGAKSCLDVGADHIYVVMDPAADGSGGTVRADTNCAGLGGAPVVELQIAPVPDGNHSFAVRATRLNQLIFYTHHPVTTLFTAPFTTAVNVTAEALP